MKLLKHKYIALLLVLAVSIISGVINAPGVQAAGCTPGTTDGTVTASQQCMETYVKECKKKHNEVFCSSLSIDNVNACAKKGSTSAFNEACLTNLESANDPSSAGSDNGSGATGNASSNVTSDLGGADQDKSDCKNNFKNLTKENCSIVKLISVITTALSSIAMLVIIMMVVLGGVQYSSAGADASKVQAAKAKISNALLALFLLIFGFSILQWLVPGGIF